MINEQKGLFSKRSCPWLLLFVFYLQFITGEVLSMLWYKYVGDDVPALVLVAAAQIFAIAIPCVIFLFLKNVNPGEVIKHRKLNLGTAFMCIITGISAQPVAALLNSPVSVKLGGENVQPLFETPTTPVMLLLTFIVVAVLPAIFEELLMRGIILHGTEKYGYRASLLISGVWFAILHNNPQSFIGVLFLGMVSCYAVWMTQSVYSGMLIHLGFNTMALIMQITAFPGSVLTSVLLVIVSLIIFVPSVSSLNRKLVRRYKTHGILKQLFFAIFNFPMILILLGYIMFYYTM